MVTRMKKKSHLGGVLVLLVFAVFMVSILLVLLTGADAVKKINRRDQESYNYRTLVQYITTRVRQADQRGMVSVRSFESGDALVLTEEIEGEMYETRVYCHDGYLRELFIDAGLEMEAEFGEAILPLDAIRFEDEGTHILAHLTLTGGEQEDLLLLLRSERGRMR